MKIRNPYHKIKRDIAKYIIFSNLAKGSKHFYLCQ